MGSTGISVCLNPSPYLEGNRILLLDIETLPAIGFFWDQPWETQIIEVIKEWQILSFSAKWLGGFQQTYINHKSDRILVGKLWKLLDEAEIVIGQNLDRFDIRKINARFLYYGLGPPSPYKTIDTLKIARKNFALLSNKQDDLGKFMGTGRKIKTDKDLWLDCIKGKKSALKRMAEYNAQDVILLEANYLKLRAWSKTNLGIHSDGIACPHCQSDQVVKRGIQKNNTTEYHRIFCNNCRGWSRLSENLRLTKPLIT